jgi:hypothetical protein
LILPRCMHPLKSHPNLPVESSGNTDLCGAPLDVACPPSALLGASPDSDSSGSLRVLMIIAIAVVAFGGLLAIIGIITALVSRNKDKDEPADTTETPGGGGGIAAAKLQSTADKSIKIAQVTGMHFVAGLELKTLELKQH